MDPYYLGKGMNTIRLPLRWERLQHSLSSTSSTTLTASQVVATFDANELAALEKSVSTLTAAGFTVLIDIHNYASYTSASEIASSQGGDQLGSANAPNVAFENLWIGLASLYANDPKVVFDIMNEPNTPKDPAGEPAGYEWYLAAQAAVTGIRGVGANNLILICGNDFAGPGDFTAGGWSDPLKAITDPSNNFAFEVHDYPDTAFGSTDTCTTTSVQSVMTDLQTFVTWAQKYKMRGFLGEFSAGIDTSAQSTCETAIADADVPRAELEHLPGLDVLGRRRGLRLERADELSALQLRQRQPADDDARAVPPVRRESGSADAAAVRPGDGARHPGRRFAFPPRQPPLTATGCSRIVTVEKRSSLPSVSLNRISTKMVRPRRLTT